MALAGAIIAVVLAAGVTAAPVASPLPAPSPSPAPTAGQADGLTKPVREVVYKVSTLLRVDDITESYGGGPNAVPPSNTSAGENHGTVTVDVMGKFADGVLAIKVSELWHTNPLPQSFNGAVAPDGTVEFAASTINAVTVELLPYLAIKFLPEGTIDTGTHWPVNVIQGKTSILTEYTVTGTAPATITIHKHQKISAIGMETVDGSVVYDPALLVAVSGQVRQRLTEMYSNGQTQGTLDVTFERVSDTFAPTKP
jgi:hypothetical protein